MAIELSSPVFGKGDLIPKKYTCDGQDVSPPLSWSGVPEGTQSLALIGDDPDAPQGTWVHWVVYNMDAKSGGLPEQVPQKESLAGGALQGVNDFRRIGYGGPCPPRGTHRYYFKLYALDTRLDLAPGASKEELLQAMEGHILDQSEFMGRYHH